MIEIAMPVKTIMGLLLILALVFPISEVHAKQHSRFVTAQMRANALANIEKYDWAASQQKDAIAQAAPYLALSDDELWEMVTSQELPRDIHTNKEVGCPNCGEGIRPYGNYPWKYDYWNQPWKLTCPNCGEVYPKNDFYAFYKTALDEHGMFRRELGDRSLLFNADHPDPNDPLHNVFVDDGYGMLDENGNRHRFIAYYNNRNWSKVTGGVWALARAYTLTSDKQYAHKAAVLLDRIADVYPEMDFYPLSRMGFEHSHGGSGKGRIVGCIWESTRYNSAYAYDWIYDGIQDDDELVQFCSQKAAQYKLGDKSSVEAICRHIEDHLLLEILKSIKDGRIAGNTGYNQRCLAVTAIALDRPEVTEEWLDWLFAPGFPTGSVSEVLVGGLDRDGMGRECGGYGLIWPRTFGDLAEVLPFYPEYTEHDIVKEYPKLKQGFLVESRLMCLDAALPAIGDSGGPGNWGRITSPTRLATGFKIYGDPRMAELAWHYANGDIEELRLPGDIYDETGATVAEQIAALAGPEAPGPMRLKCEHFGRYGQAILQTESPDNGRALWMHYSASKGHSHYDSLNLGLYARRIDMLPEMGYPEYTGSWPKRHAWTAHTISHNTLLVNDTKNISSGKINLFVVAPPVRLIDVSCSNAYGGIETYRRMAALIDVSEDDSYVFDVFRARGGTNHRLSYHGPAETATVTGLKLVKQERGTFAGPDVEFAEFYDGPSGSGYKGSGFMYLYDVERSEGPVDNYFTVDWKADGRLGTIREGEEPHLRLHSLSSSDEVALASGEPPQNRRNPLRCMRYVIQSRLGENMESQFVTVLEPYDTTPFIRQVRRLRVEHEADENSVAAVAVELQNGTTDILISCEKRTKVRVEDDIEFDGQFGMIRLVNGEVKLMRMSNATLLRYGTVKLVSDQAAFEGIVTEIDASDPENHLVFVDPPLPQEPELVGKTIHFKNELSLDTSYDIKAVGEGWISTGEITIIQGFKDPNDYDAGYNYLVNVGDEYVVPCIVRLDR